MANNGSSYFGQPSFFPAQDNHCSPESLETWYSLLQPIKESATSAQVGGMCTLSTLSYFSYMADSKLDSWVQVWEKVYSEWLVRVFKDTQVYALHDPLHILTEESRQLARTLHDRAFQDG